MIRYKITLNELENLVGEKWLKKAKARTTKFKNKGFYEEKSSIWSEIKEIYMTLQGDSKCAFCERKLESVERGKGEQAVEHFRPKGLVKHWELSVDASNLNISLTKVSDDNKGYYLLAYHLFNYSASCNPCNSVLKGSYFPVKGNYDLQGNDPNNLKAEMPYLIYPISDFDDDPEDLIYFVGISPVSKKTSGFEFERAFVTIRFFELDNQANRSNLFLERANIIVALFPQLENLTKNVSQAEKDIAQILINGFTSEKCSHTNCARSFVKLFNTDKAKARQIFQDASKYIASKSSPR